MENITSASAAVVRLQVVVRTLFEKEMTVYLFRVSTKKTDVWSNKAPKPVYVVQETKEKAEEWANRYLANGLSISKISKLARQVGGTVFVAT